MIRSVTVLLHNERDRRPIVAQVTSRLRNHHFFPAVARRAREYRNRLTDGATLEGISNSPITVHYNRPLSRRLDRCDRVIQDEVGDSNGGNV